MGESLDKTIVDKCLSTMTEKQMLELDRNQLLYNCIKRDLQPQIEALKKVPYKKDLASILKNYFNAEPENMDGSIYIPKDSFVSCMAKLGKYSDGKNIQYDTHSHKYYIPGPDGKPLEEDDSDPDENPEKPEEKKSDPPKPPKSPEKPKPKPTNDDVNTQILNQLKNQEQINNQFSKQMAALSKNLEHLTIQSQSRSSDYMTPSGYTSSGSSTSFPFNYPKPIVKIAENENLLHGSPDTVSNFDFDSHIQAMKFNSSMKLVQSFPWIENFAELGYSKPLNELYQYTDLEAIRLITGWSPKPNTNEPYLKNKLLYAIFKCREISSEKNPKGSVFLQVCAEITVSALRGQKISNERIELLIDSKISQEIHRKMIIMEKNSQDSLFQKRSSSSGRGRGNRNSNSNSRGFVDNQRRIATCDWFNKPEGCKNGHYECEYPHFCSSCTARGYKNSHHNKQSCPYGNSNNQQTPTQKQNI